MSSLCCCVSDSGANIQKAFGVLVIRKLRITVTYYSNTLKVGVLNVVSLGDLQSKITLIC